MDSMNHVSTFSSLLEKMRFILHLLKQDTPQSEVVKKVIEDVENIQEQLHQNITKETIRHDAMTSTGIGLWNWWPHDNRITVDGQWGLILGIDTKDLPEHLDCWEEWLHPEDKPRILEDLHSYLEGKTLIYENVHRMRHHDGRWIWILDRGIITEKSPSGEPIRYTGIHIDITKYKEQEQLLNHIITSLDDIIFDISEDKTILGVWCKNEAILLAPKKELIGKTLKDFLPTKLFQTITHHASISWDEKSHREFEYDMQPSPSHSKEQFLAKIIPNTHHHTPRWTMMISNITELKKRQEAEENTKAELNHFFSLSLDLLTIASFDGIIKKLNPAWDQVLGYSIQELEGQHFMNFIHPDDLPKTQVAFSQLLQGRPILNFESRMKCKDGQFKIFSTSAKADMPANVFYAASRDVTLEKETAQLLAEAQKVAQIGSWSFEIKTQKIRWSDAMYDLFPENKTQGPPSFDRHYSTVHPEDQGHWKKTVKQCLIDGKKYSMRFRSVFPDGKIIYIQAHGEAKYDLHGVIEYLHGTCQNVTDLVMAENDLKYERAKSIQNAKLAALGEMSAGVAHEINNPISIILGSAHSIKKTLQSLKIDEKKIFTALESIEKSSKRISKIVLGLRKFSRNAHQQEHTHQKLSDLIKEAMILTETKSKRHHVSLDLELNSKAQILCNEIEIEQVIINLINNSVDAIKNSSDRWIKIEVFDRNESCILKITDSGKGIPKNIQSELFKPFFTTKKMGEGTGLGLSIVKGIIENHHGTIEILHNSPNTCFEVAFPIINFSRDKA